MAEELNLLDLNESESNEKFVGKAGEKILPHEYLKESSTDEPYAVKLTATSTSTSTAITELSEISKIIVRLRIVNMGSDMKFEEDPFNITLHGIMDPFEYSSSIRKINEELEKCRANAIDHALLAVGPTIIPLIPWAVRQKLRKNARRKILAQCIEVFNKEHPQLFMRWQTRPEKELSIMTKSAAIKLLSK